MVYQPRMRKRVNAYPIRRGPDGSAFQKCERCGRSVAIALADMHECESNNSLKKLKGQRQSGNVKSQNIEDQPRSAFRFFMYYIAHYIASYIGEELLDIHKEENEIAIDSKGFEMWKKMSKQERQPYLVKAEKVNSAHTKALLEEENDMSWVKWMMKRTQQKWGSTTRTMQKMDTLMVLNTISVMIPTIQIAFFSGLRSATALTAKIGQRSGPRIR